MYDATQRAPTHLRKGYSPKLVEEMYSKGEIQYRARPDWSANLNWQPEGG
jgi:hypothetical protein